MTSTAFIQYSPRTMLSFLHLWRDLASFILWPSVAQQSRNFSLSFQTAPKPSQPVPSRSVLFPPSYHVSSSALVMLSLSSVDRMSFSPVSVKVWRPIRNLEHPFEKRNPLRKRRKRVDWTEKLRSCGVIELRFAEREVLGRILGHQGR